MPLEVEMSDDTNQADTSLQYVYLPEDESVMIPDEWPASENSEGLPKMGHVELTSGNTLVIYGEPSDEYGDGYGTIVEIVLPYLFHKALRDQRVRSATWDQSHYDYEAADDAGWGHVDYDVPSQQEYDRMAEARQQSEA